MSMLRIGIGALTLCGVLAATQFGATAGDDAYTIVLKKVEVKKTQKNGESWDINDGKPDLRVIIRNTSDKDAKEFESKEKTDVYSAEFNEPTTVKFRPGQTVEFHVVDVDVAVNDTIGKTAVEMKGDKLKTGVLRLENFDQVVHLEIEVKKL